MILLQITEVPMKQLRFNNVKAVSLSFGGDKLLGHRKEMRPLSVKKPLHLIIHPEELKREHSFVKYKVEIQTLISKTAKQFGIKIHDKSINFTHLHLIISFSARRQYVSFIRVFNAAIIRLLELKSKKSMKGIFKLRPFTRVVHFGRDFKNLLLYLQTNRFEAQGLRVRNYASTIFLNPLETKRISILD